MRRFGVMLLAIVLWGLVAACGTHQAPSQAGRVPTSTPIVRDELPPSVPSPTQTHSPAPNPAPVPDKSDVPPKSKLILVSLSRQWLYSYEDGRPVFDHAVETGRPELPTPSGTFRVLEKVRDVMFTSPWPEGSPHYYEPTHVNHALLFFKEGGFFLHDAGWHEQFGPGSNVPHQLPDGSWETGSHGCVGMPIPDAERLYKWASTGTPVIISE